jgi:Tfp pilus assembly protein PilX
MQRLIIPPCCKNEDGFALVIALIMLVVLTLLGIAATNTTVVELNIAGNERVTAQQFDAADSGWQQAVPYLDRKASPPDFINQTLAATNPDYQIVRNYGSGGDGILNSAFTAGTQDGVFANMLNIQYWYRVIYSSDAAAPKFGTNYRTFQYDTECNAVTAGGSAEVATILAKVYKVGY